MANDQNLRPCEYHLTAEDGRRGGIASGEASLSEVPDMDLQVFLPDDGPRRGGNTFGNEDGLIQKVLQHRNLLRPYVTNDSH